MENALSTINLLPSTLDQITLFVSNVKDEALSGEYNVLEVLIQLRAAQQALETLNKDEEILESAMKEYDKYGEKTVDFGGVKITKKEAGTKYEYEACNDAKWHQFKTIEQVAAEQRKGRETFLKSLTEPMTVVDELTGETSVICPAPKTSKTTLAISLK